MYMNYFLNPELDARTACCRFSTFDDSIIRVTSFDDSFLPPYNYAFAITQY